MTDPKPTKQHQPPPPPSHAAAVAAAMQAAQRDVTVVRPTEDVRAAEVMQSARTRSKAHDTPGNVKL